MDSDDKRDSEDAGAAQERDRDEQPEPKADGAAEAFSAVEPRAEDSGSERGDEDAGDESVDLEARVLCPDGACIGVIGADGRCKVCGRTASSESGKSPSTDESRPGSVDDPEPPLADGADADPDLDLESRKLCSDGACIGVIGADGRCKVCHKPYSGDPD